jgi:hypothetical protein
MIPRLGQHRFRVANSANIGADKARQKVLGEEEDWRHRDRRPGRFAVSGSFIVLPASEATTGGDPSVGNVREPDAFYL